MKKKRWITIAHRMGGLFLAAFVLAGCGKQEAQPVLEVSTAESDVKEQDSQEQEKTASISEMSALDVMCAPSGMAVMEDGTLLVTDAFYKRIWKVKDGASEIYAGGDTVEGIYGEPMGGYNDADLLSSYFKSPWAVAKFMDGWAVSDTQNNVVRMVRDKKVQTINAATEEELKVGDTGVLFERPTGLATDKDGSLYIADTGNGAVRKLNTDGKISTVAKNLNEPMGLCWKNGVLYIAETGNNRILKLEGGIVSTVAGSGEEGLADGEAQAAQFAAPQGVAVDDNGVIYVADTLNSAVRRIRDGQVDTVAAREAANTDFGLISPTGLMMQGNDRLYICDVFSRKVFVLDWV